MKGTQRREAYGGLILVLTCWQMEMTWGGIIGQFCPANIIDTCSACCIKRTKYRCRSYHFATCFGKVTLFLTLIWFEASLRSSGAR